jgi:hypothetical protein
MLILLLGRSLSTGAYRFVLSDLLVLLTGVWMFLAVSFSQGADMALAHAGPEILEICVGYATTRIIFTQHGHALSFVSLLCRTIGVVALLGLLDPLTGHVLTHEIVNSLTGYDFGWLAHGGLRRHGLVRAYGPLEQPLLFGLTCYIGLIIALSVRVRARVFVIIACSLGIFFSGESAPILGVALSMGLLLYNRVLGAVSLKWPILIALASVAIAAVFMVSNDPSSVIVRHLTFDPQTGYYRLWTWGLATDLLRQSPWFGLGFMHSLRGVKQALPSIDNLWLGFALLYGYPGAVLLFLSVLGAMSISTNPPRANLTAAEANLGTTLSIILLVIMLIAYTVHVWGTDRILMGLLIGARAHLGALGRLRLRVQSGRPIFGLGESKSTGATL